MITALIIIYSFMAGMTAEYTHTRLKKISASGGLVLTAIILGILWPYEIFWRSK
ncbi:hypothetical protein P2117_003794 [Klebsiella michiganensis]|nr:hypothetical protein [Klebsiella michiganensis]